MAAVGTVGILAAASTAASGASSGSTSVTGASLVSAPRVSTAPSGTPPPSTRPNVVLILTDDQRFDTLWAMPKVRADIAGHGLTFANGFVTNSLCCPSRTSILTGQYSHSTGVYTNEPPYGGFQAFRGDRSTIATWLHSAGYQTGLIGKYLNQYQMNRYVPPGWDHWFAFANVGYYDYTINRNGRFQSYGSKPSDYSTDVLAADAESFIAGADPAKPLFLYFAPHAPHTPVVPAPRYAHAFEGLAPWRPPNFDEPNVATKPAWVRHLPRFGAAEDQRIDDLRLGMLRTLLSVDDAVDGIVRSLAATGRLSNTMIVFMSDNGYAWGEHRWVGKQDAYEESIRVPFVVRYDPLTGTPRTDDHLVTNIDLAPTFAALAGMSAPGMEGRSLLPLLRDPTAPWRQEFSVEHEVLVDSYPITTFCGVRTQRYLYVDYATHEEELYDVVRDPFELVNLVDDPARAEVLASLREQVRDLCRPALPGWTFGVERAPRPPPSGQPPSGAPPPRGSSPSGGSPPAPPGPSPSGAASREATSGTEVIGGRAPVAASSALPAPGAGRGASPLAAAGGLGILFGILFGPSLIVAVLRRR